MAHPPSALSSWQVGMSCFVTAAQAQAEAKHRASGGALSVPKNKRAPSGPSLGGTAHGTAPPGPVSESVNNLMCDLHWKLLVQLNSPNLSQAWLFQVSKPNASLKGLFFFFSLRLLVAEVAVQEGLISSTSGEPPGQQSQLPHVVPPRRQQVKIGTQEGRRGQEWHPRPRAPPSSRALLP